MLNVTDETVFIMPSSQKEITLISNMIRYNGTARGFFLDDALVIFSSYGNTHHSMACYFRKQNGRWSNITDCFIIQNNGDVSIDGISRPITIEYDYEPFCNHKRLWKAIAGKLGNSKPMYRPFE